MICRTFFRFTQTGESVSSANPQDLSSPQVWAELVAHLSDENDYVGLMDADDNVLQITRESENAPYHVEVLLTDRRESFSTTLAADELKSLLGRLPPRFKPSSFPGLISVEWRKDTGSSQE